LGRAAALGLATAGASVVVVGRQLADCRKTTQEIEALGRRALPLACDVGNWDAVADMMRNVGDTFGRPDVLVNNAGVSDMTHLTEVTPQLFDRIFHVLVRAPLQLASLIAQMSDGSRDVSIINVTSVAAMRPEPFAGCYCSAKAALQALTRVMAREWADQRVRVNAIAPGPFMTDMMTQAIADNPAVRTAVEAKTVMQRIGQPDEIVGAILFLASRASSFVTGETLVVSGGA
jgi:NAD(P)-dependent dehydrogenase (short-subunit alcohol dehydrogenase family)